MKYFNLIIIMLLFAVMVACGESKSERAARIEKEQQDSIVRVEAVKEAERKILETRKQDSIKNIEAERLRQEQWEKENFIRGGIKLKGKLTYRSGYTANYLFTFYKDHTMRIDLSNDNGASEIFEGTWKKESDSFHDKEYTWYTLRFNVSGEMACAFVDSKLRMYGPMNDGSYKVGGMIDVMDDKSHPKHEQIASQCHQLSTVN